MAVTEREILNSVAKGGIARQRGKDSDFAEVLSAIQAADRKGYLMDPKYHRSSTTKDSEVDLVSVTKLSEPGRQRLKELLTEP